MPIIAAFTPALYSTATTLTCPWQQSTTIQKTGQLRLTQKTGQLRLTQSQSNKADICYSSGSLAHTGSVW